MQQSLASAVGGLDISIFMLVFVAIVLLGSNVVDRGQRHGRRWRNPARTHLHVVGSGLHSASPKAISRSTDPVEQLRAVMAGEFTAKRVLSRTEARVLDAADEAIVEAGLKWRVMAQVALGEVLASESEAAFFAINAKRVDLLIVSEKSEPIAAIEYQGQGHYQGTAPARDAIKKEALREAGIAYIEITHEHGPKDVRREVARLAFIKSRDFRASLRKVMPVS